MTDIAVATARKPHPQPEPEPASNGCCWILRDSEGRELDASDTDPHFRTRTEAQQKIRTEGGRFRAGIPTLLPSPCVTLECAACETPFDEEGEGYIVHFDTAEEALDLARGFEWTVTDGKATCSGCMDEAR